MTQGKARGAKRHPKNAMFGKRETNTARAHHGLTMADSVGRGGCHGRGGRVFPQLLWFPSRPFVFPRDFFFLVLCCYFAFKRGFIWLHLRVDSIA